MIWFFAVLGFLTQPVSPLTIPTCCHQNEIKLSKGCHPSGFNLTADFDGRPYEFSYKPCNSNSVPVKMSEVILRNDSRLEYKSDETIENYCFAFVNFSGEIELIPMVCIEDDYIALYSDEGEGETYATALLNNIGLIIGVPFLIVTCCVYSLLRVFKNIYGKCVRNSSFSFSMSYIVLLVVRLLSDKDYFPDSLCIGFGFAVQFFFLATFFWLNVMCIDIYWAFSGFKLRGSASERDRKKLLAYSMYAWGMPLIILAVTVGVDYYDAIPATSSFKPNMGKDKCFFKSRTATWTYFYGPMAVILFSNLILFAVTAFRIWRHRRETAVLQRGDSRRHDGNESERFNLYLKLFLVMGINWISELVSFMFGKDVPQYLWYITDITNTLQGVFIFLIFVWKKRVRKLLWDKFKKKQANVTGSTMTASTALNGSMR